MLGGVGWVGGWEVTLFFVTHHFVRVESVIQFCLPCLHFAHHHLQRARGPGRVCGFTLHSIANTWREVNGSEEGLEEGLK